MISLTLTQFRNLIDTDDGLALERFYITRNTAAGGECVVIREEIAQQILAADPDGSVVHIQVYDVNLDAVAVEAVKQGLLIKHTSKGTAVFTAWHPTTWAESAERRRLRRVDNAEWRADLKRQETSITIARDFKRALAVLISETESERFFKRMLEVAHEVNYDPDKVLAVVARFKETFNLK